MKFPNRGECCLAGLLLAAGLWLNPLAAQTFPSKPIQLVVPSLPGAAYDLVGRIIADGARDGLGSIVVDDRPGGNYSIGADVVRRAAPDGHTLLLGGNVLVLSEAMNLTRSYNLFKDFEPVGQLTNLPFYLVVQHDTVPVETLRELVDYVKARPGKLIYLSPGNSALHYFAMESLKMEAGLDILHVPYKAMGQGVSDMLAGRLNMTITGYPAVAPHMKSGKFKILATVNPRRTVFLPEIPTFAEAGVPGVELVSWFGILAPAGTPRAIINRLNAEFNRALKKPDIRERFAQQGLELGGGSPEEMVERIRADYEKYLRIVKATGVKGDGG